MSELNGGEALLAVVLIIFGVLCTISGTKLFAFYGPIIAFGTGFVYMDMFMYEVTEDSLVSLSTAASVGGLFMALFFAKWRATMFLTGAFAGYVLTYMIIALSEAVLFKFWVAQLAIVLAFALVGGLLHVQYEREGLAVATSLSGSWAFFVGVGLFDDMSINPIDMSHDEDSFQCTTGNCVTLMIVFAALSVFGAVAQYYITSDRILWRNVLPNPPEEPVYEDDAPATELTKV